jgi:hypothetical protein
MEYTQDQINGIISEARSEAARAANEYFHTKLGGQDQYACGFAWVDILGIKGNTKLGRMLKAAGVSRSDYKKCFSIWNPSGLPCQNIDTKEEGAIAAAKVLQKYGFRAMAGSRLD